MKLSPITEPVIIDDKVVGFSLSADYTAEHEWGIKPIQKATGIQDASGLGIERRKVSGAGCIRKYKNDQYCVVFFPPYNPHNMNLLEEQKKYADRFLKEYPYSKLNPGDLASEWSTDGFIIVERYNTDSVLDNFYNEFVAKNDLVIMLYGSTSPFGRGGLLLMGASAVPSNVAEEWYNSDKDQMNLEAEIVASGIRDFLKEHGKRYFALSGRWLKGDLKNKKTAYKVIFWLNPWDQDKHNYGWFTVEELMEWGNNLGPVMQSRQLNGV